MMACKSDLVVLLLQHPTHIQAATAVASGHHHLPCCPLFKGTPCCQSQHPCPLLLLDKLNPVALLLQVITTFLGSLLVGSFLNQITEFLDNPGGVVNTLGSSAPQTATFFMTFILIQAFIKQPLQLLRLPGLIFFWLKSRLATTNRQKAALWKDARLQYGRNVSAPSSACLEPSLHTTMHMAFTHISQNLSWSCIVLYCECTVHIRERMFTLELHEWRSTSLCEVAGYAIFWVHNDSASSVILLHDVLQVGNDTIIMLIGLVYCVIQPIIAPLAMIYFLIGMLIWKYQVVYVYVPLVESGGKVTLHTCFHAFSQQSAISLHVTAGHIALCTLLAGMLAG